MKYIQSFVSNAILFFLFNDADLIAPNSSIKRFNMYDDIDDYLIWAKKRIETAFYELSGSDISPAEKIRRVDRKLIQIFPFLTRVIDRSYMIERFLTALELFEIGEAESDSSLEQGSLNEASPEKQEEIQVKESPQVQAEESPPSPPVLVVRRPFVPISPSRASPSLIGPQNNTPRAEPVPLNQSLHKLRRAAQDVGIQYPFLLSKKELAEKLAAYNDGLNVN